MSEQGEAQILKLAQRCRWVKDIFTLLRAQHVARSRPATMAEGVSTGSSNARRVASIPKVITLRS
jgi:hypothetical protein